MPEHVAAGLLAQMLGAVQHLGTQHGVVHRDVKPENFLFSTREARREPLPPLAAPLKLIDFGLSRRLGFEAGARMTPKIGTTEYMAPEAFAGRIKPMLADRTDVWSMGVLLHVIFIGHFPSPRLAEIELKEYLALPCWARVSSRGRDFLGTLLHHDPAQRPNVTTAMKHPWLSLAARPDSVRSAAHIPHAIKSFASSHELRRLALAVAARELDDRELVTVRRL